MNILVPDIKIFSSLDLTGRPWRSSGTKKVTELNGLPCKPKTFVPSEPWHELNNEEKNIFIGDMNVHDIPYQSVGLFRLPESLQNKFEALRLNDGQSKSEVYRKAETPEAKAVITEAMKFCQRFQRTQEDHISQNISVSEPGRLTVTWNKNENVFIGLHLDSWERSPVSVRHEVRNRICINLGNEPRYIMFVNLQLQTMLKTVGNNVPSQVVNSPNDIGPYFFEKFPEYPVLKMQVNPYEAYIAPTENFIHDGSTWNKKNLDIHLTFRSFYNVIPEKKKSIFSFSKIFKPKKQTQPS